MVDESKKNQRRKPRQARSRATCDAIVEAAAQILERRGADALTTNEVAERAGVSIGTLYQYFADKEAVLLAAARREIGALPGRQRALLEALIATLERLCGLRAGGAAAGRRQAAGTQPLRGRRGSNSIRQGFEVIREWTGALIFTPAPVLRPIPVRRRRPE